MQKRLATFDFPKDDSDDVALERAWNTFTDALRAKGLRPSDIPVRSCETSVTYRLFSIEHEEMVHTLDFDIAKLVGKAAIAVGALVALSAPFFETVGHLARATVGA